MLRLGRLVFLRNKKRADGMRVISVPGNAKCIRMFATAILKMLKPFAVSEERAFDIKLCVEEAVRNAIVHGNHSDYRKKVTVAYGIKNDRLIVEVEDEGAGFDHVRVPDPTVGDNLLKNSGRGVYLIRRLMDSAVYNDSGNKIIMEKKIR